MRHDLSITGPEDTPSELKRFRELIATNREERFRLSKNLTKVSRQLSKTKAHVRDAVQSTAAVANARSGAKDLGRLKKIYSRLAETFKTIEPHNRPARNCLSRLVIRCESCADRDMTAADHATQLEGVRFEYLLALRTQGPDEAQVKKYAAVEKLVGMIAKALKSCQNK